MDEDGDKYMLTVPYREGAQTRKGIARLALAPHLQSGRDTAGCVSNFWFATQQCVSPKSRAVWARLEGGREHDNNT